MENIYRFSPIINEQQFESVLDYIVKKTEDLSQKVLNKSLPINTIKVFSHYLDEQEYLFELVSKLGDKAIFSSNTSLYVKVKRLINGHNIEYIGVRTVDPYRLHVGCGDYELQDFYEFKKEHIDKSPFVRLFSEEMLEVWHPNFDVLGYVVPPL